VERIATGTQRKALKIRKFEENSRAGGKIKGLKIALTAALVQKTIEKESH